MSGLRKSQHLKIPLREIELATKNFQTCIGKGGYGLVFRGELSISGIPTTVAVKRLNEQFGQGLKEFLTEIQLLTGQSHPNLISLLGYCDEGREKIIVYEYAERGSLDKYLTNNNTNYTLTWLERLKICVDAARGLDHLHNHAGEHQTIIHRDVKSANILLDQNWVAKISDLGLSRLSFAGLSAVISRACGTPGYCEPEYIITGIVKKESDVYSFGMVLFEVLCGRLCSVRHPDGLLLSALVAKAYYEKKNLDEIIDPGLREQMFSESMSKFSAIAYGCVQDDRGRRPTMDLVVKELVRSLEIQVAYEYAKQNSPIEFWEMTLPQDSEEIIKRLSPGVIYTSKMELLYLLQRGILFDNKKRFFWINDDGKKCELISATRFLEAKDPIWLFQPNVRFSRVAKLTHEQFHGIKYQIKTTTLSLDTKYAASLVFKYRGQSNEDLKCPSLIAIKWKLEELVVYCIHAVELIADNWNKIKMWHFINHAPEADFDIVMEEFMHLQDTDKSHILIQGIEFQPIERIQHEEIEGGIQSLSTYEEDHIFEDIYWEKRLPHDYQRYIQLYDEPLNYTSKKDLYFILCAGFLACGGELWFSLCKSTSGICSMLSTFVLRYRYEPVDTCAHSESRFGQVKELKDLQTYSFLCRLQLAMFSPEHIYACYLVFKFKDKHIRLDDTCMLNAHCTLDGQYHSTNCLHLNIPKLKSGIGYGSHGSSNIPSTEGFWTPKCCIYHDVDGWKEERKDGLMEIILCRLLFNLESHDFLEVELKSTGRGFFGIIVEGIEFRPMLTHM